MSEFKILIKKPLISMLAQLNKFYYKINMILEKHQAINKSYEPKINEKLRINTLLHRKVNDFTSANLKLNSKIEKVSKENILLQNKIDLMQELIIKK